MRNECDNTVEPSSNQAPGGTLSNEDTDVLPTNLLSDELQLALNQVSNPVSFLLTGSTDSVFQEATEHELLKAINRCKELILENTECSVERKWIVRHLIELRFRLQEYKEAMEDPR